MSRPDNRVRDAGPEDIGALIGLITLARGESPLTAQLCTLESDHLDTLLHAWIGLEGSRLLVAEMDETIVGFTLVQRVEPNLFSDVTFLQIEGLFVHEAHRRRGIARSLLAEVSRLAEDNGIEHIITIVLTGSRQELRFLAGLGFAPAGARRVVDTATLNRRLGGGARERRMRGIDELIARRRRIREHSTTG